jgi:hypothetical protein
LGDSSDTSSKRPLILSLEAVSNLSWSYLLNHDSCLATSTTSSLHYFNASGTTPHPHTSQFP